MSPLTAKLKCPHGRGKDIYESEAVTEVGGDGFGGGRKDNAEGGGGKDRNVLPADQTDSKEGSRKRSERAPSGNTGNPSNHRMREGIKAKVLQLSQKVYGEFNDQHFTEKLTEEEGIEVSRETVRKIRRAAGIGPKRKRRGKKHRKRRERRAQEGWMVLWDGSPHPWFGQNLPPCCLMAALDDATGGILAARFFPFEGTEGYLWLLRQIVTQYGIPISIYQDRHGSLKRNDDHWTLEEELAGRQEPTQVGQALRALGIQPIFALSPQAKGRIERLFGTLQDRLGAELGLLAKVNHPSAGQ